MTVKEDHPEAFVLASSHEVISDLVEASEIDFVKFADARCVDVWQASVIFDVMLTYCEHCNIPFFLGRSIVTAGNLLAGPAGRETRRASRKTTSD